MAEKPTYEELGKRIQELEQADLERKQVPDRHYQSQADKECFVGQRSIS